MRISSIDFYVSKSYNEYSVSFILGGIKHHVLRRIQKEIGLDINPDRLVYNYEHNRIV